MSELSAAEQAKELGRTYDPFDAKFLENEHADYDQMREHCPIVFAEAMTSPQAPSGWIITEYGDSVDFLQDHTTFSNQAADGYPVRPWIPQAIDPPAHTAYRRILNPMFTVAAMRPLEPHLDEFANELVDAMLKNDEFDFVVGLADPFPTKIFCELAGFPTEDYAQIMDWKNTLMHTSDGHSLGYELAATMANELGFDVTGGRPLTPDEEMTVRIEVGVRIYAYMGTLIEARRAEPRDDMISWLLAAEYEGERELTQEELEDTLFLFYMAGLDTVASALGLIVQDFATDPAKRQEFLDLMDDESKLDMAIEELVRVHSIVLLPRRITADVDFHGTEMAKEQQAMCPTMAANRDPKEFENPHEVEFDRSPNRHIGFGLGAHRCIGIHLARRELKIALVAFHQKCPNYVLDPNKKAEAFGGMKGMASLPLVKA